MKALGICGSPRKGNTEWMLQKLLEKISSRGAETELIRLRQLDIRNCKGCLSCEKGRLDRTCICKIKDDMQEIYQKLLQADVLILGTPVYFELLSGLLKTFLDRTCPIWPKLRGKLIAGIAVAEEGTGKAIDNLKTYALVCDLQWVGHITALAKTPVQVAKQRDIEKRLDRLAKKLVGSLKSD